MPPPRYEMISLSLHETNPGHHLQSSYTLERPDWPMFRKVQPIFFMPSYTSSYPTHVQHSP